MISKPLRLLPIVTLCAVGCVESSDDGSPVEDEPGTVDQRAEAGEPAEGMFRLQMPETTVPPGAEQQTCWVADWTLEKDAYVSSMTTYQGSMGHHFAMFASTVPREPGEIFDCTQLESMTNLRPAVLPDRGFKGKDELMTDGGLLTLPEGFVVKVPAGTTVVLQSHYVNVSAEEVTISDVVDLTLTEPDDDTMVASYFVINDDLVDIPEGRHDRKVWCEVPEDISLIALLGHMHDWGESISIEREVEGQDREVLWNIDKWLPDFRDNAPITVYEPEEALGLSVGDKIHVSCSYNNTESGPLRFPTEMCTAVGIYYPAVDNDEDGVILCDTQYE